jgi:hypothetical protein
LTGFTSSTDLDDGNQSPTVVVTPETGRKRTHMAWSLVPLLIHSDSVPREAQIALKAALDGPPELRSASLERAARAIYRATGLDCDDVRELVGLTARS